MKKFKHKKTGEIATYKDGVLTSSGFSVEIGVEPSSKIWEEISEKIFEIVAFKQDSGIEDLWTYFPNKGWCRNVDGNPITVPYETLDSILNNHLNRGIKYFIYSVKRLSDGETFTVGDRVTYYGYKTNIKSIYYNEHNQLSFKVEGSVAPLTGVFSKKMHLSKDIVLFTTEDNFSVYEGDKYYFIVLNENLHTNLIIQEHVCNWDNPKKPPLGAKQFYTKEAAEEWLLLNKLCLSINDVKNADKKPLFFSSLKQIVKSRL